MSSYVTFYHLIWVRDRLLVANVNYIKTKKFARRFLCLIIKYLFNKKYIFNSAFYESLGREILLSSLEHPDVLLVLLQIMKVLIETDEEIVCLFVWLVLNDASTLVGH